VACTAARILRVPTAVSWCITASAGPHLAHRGEQILTIQYVGHHGLRTGGAQPLSMRLAPGDPDDLMAP
jgi:hypothetical protein